MATNIIAHLVSPHPTPSHPSGSERTERKRGVWTAAPPGAPGSTHPPSVLGTDYKVGSFVMKTTRQRMGLESENLSSNAGLATYLIDTYGQVT